MSKLLTILMGATGLNEFDLRRIIRNAPIRYKIYEIPKRNGRGTRTISQPAREVKVLQRILVTTVLSDLPIHPSAMAYRPGISIRDNAAAHAGGGPIAKFDFKNFFPSIVARDWEIYCRKMSLFEDERDIDLSTNIFFHRKKGSTIRRLAIGAPSSPTLSNVIMNLFDTRLAELVSNDQVTYTRYADDLTFSARRIGFLRGVERALGQVIREIDSPSLTINKEKTVLATRKYKRMVTGLILTNNGTVSIGHERKKIIRAALHHAEQGKLNDVELVHLSGLLAFVKSAEPEFLETLMQRYGSELIARIKATKKPRRIV